MGILSGSCCPWIQCRIKTKNPRRGFLFKGEFENQSAFATTFIN
jgi:hypothetical protein